MIFVIGLAVIIAGWIVQARKSLVKRDWGLSPTFLLLYATGVAILSGGNFSENDVTIGILNTIAVILAATIAITLILQKKTVAKL